MIRCDNCKHWDSSGHAHLYINAHPDEKVGICRRYPPVRNMDFKVDAQDDYNRIAAACDDWRAWQQPVITGEEYCGEHAQC